MAAPRKKDNSIRPPSPQAQLPSDCVWCAVSLQHPGVLRVRPAAGQYGAPLRQHHQPARRHLLDVRPATLPNKPCGSAPVTARLRPRSCWHVCPMPSHQLCSDAYKRQSTPMVCVQAGGPGRVPGLCVRLHPGGRGHEPGAAVFRI